MVVIMVMMFVYCVCVPKCVMCAAVGPGDQLSGAPIYVPS